MRIAIVFLTAVIFSGIPNTQAQSGMRNAMPHVLVYKTRKQYRNLVPVQLSADKKSIASYPAPGDVKAGSGYLSPIELHGGYLLDKTGVSGNTAFLRLSYREYSKLKEVPAPEQLYKLIIDKEPIKELCDCGVRSKSNSAASLNAMIDKKQLRKKCTVIK